MTTKKIMIIDDDVELLRLVKTRLKVNEYEVITASNGEEGLEKARAERPNLILLDIQMPKMDGYTFIKTLRKEEGSLKDVPIIVISAKGKMEDLFRMEGVSDYIVKPFEAKDLLEKVEKYREKEC